MGQKIDFLIKELLNEKFDSIVCPPKEEMWQQIEQKLMQRNNKKNPKGLSNYTKIWFPFKSISDYFYGKLIYLNIITGRKNKNISK